MVTLWALARSHEARAVVMRREADWPIRKGESRLFVQREASSLRALPGPLDFRGGLNIGSHHADLMVFFRQIMRQQVAQRNDGHKPLALADRQMAKTVVAHQHHAIFHALLRAHG